MLRARQMPEGPRWLSDFVLARWEASLRVADFMTKCAIFIGHTRDGEFRPLGTAFFVGYPLKDGACQYLVTAQHIVVGRTDLQIRLNLRNGQSEIFDLPPDQWIFHPDPARTVDVAAMRSHVSLFIYDIVQISLKTDSAIDDILDRWDIGIGDEVFFPGLFIHHSGQGRNLPIIRSGTIAAMRDEPIKTSSGSISAYLIEARSIGGHSGSPVFVNMLVERPPGVVTPRRAPRPDEEKRGYYLLGLIRGHLRARDTGEYATAIPAQDDLWVNSGIATVIPAQDIWDTLNQPELEEERMVAWRASHKENVDVPDSAALPSDASGESAAATKADENPAHREDFNRLVGAASKPKPKGGQT
jgi:hypothetical protein